MNKKATEKRGSERKVIARNRRARFDYDLEVTIEAGLVLYGSEVKSLRDGGVSLDQAYGRMTDGEAWLLDLGIPEHKNSSWANHLPKRTRKLLLHARELRKIQGLLAQKGRAFIPLELYFNSEGRVKIEMAVGAGRQVHDKRENLAKREAQREMDRALRAGRR